MRAILVSGFLAASLIAGCSAANAPSTAAPIPSAANESSAPVSVDVTPTADPTPEATTAPTAAPSPTLSLRPSPVTLSTIKLKSREDLIAAKHPPVTRKVAKAKITAAYSANEKAISLYPYAAANFKSCVDGDNDPNPKWRLLNRQNDCERTVNNLFRVYRQTDDEAFYDAALAVYNYATSANGLGQGFRKLMNEYLRVSGF